MNDYLMHKKYFREINFDDSFFTSLKNDYVEFDQWCRKKKDEECYVVYQNSNIIGFLYLKIEQEEIHSNPPLPNKKRVKIGTFKIEAHGTKLGERFIKKTLDFAIINQLEEVYSTVLEKHRDIISLLLKYGFEKQSHLKSNNRTEEVYLRNLLTLKDDIVLDYPKIKNSNTNKFLLSIYPKFHTKMFPDSKLNTENFNILEDISHTNSIHKVYLAKMQGIDILKKGDIIIIYRTKDAQSTSAEYTSVVTSICTVEAYSNISCYSTKEAFIKDIVKYSIFTEEELTEFYQNNKYPHIIKMLYNIALPTRITRHNLIEEGGLERDKYFGFLKITNDQFHYIINKGKVNESFIIN